MESHEPQSCASVKLPSLCLQLIICFELLPWPTLDCNDDDMMMMMMWSPADHLLQSCFLDQHLTLVMMIWGGGGGGGGGGRGGGWSWWWWGGEGGWFLELIICFKPLPWPRLDPAQATLAFFIGNAILSQLAKFQKYPSTKSNLFEFISPHWLKEIGSFDNLQATV